MKPWWQIATPHRDIREKRLNEAVFQADLSDVIQKRGSIEYRDPETFFGRTYLTTGLENLIGNVLLRLSGKGKGEGVIHLQTPFGGGKTHALLALYHIAKYYDKISHLEAIKKILRDSGISEVPQIKVCTFVGTYSDPLKGKTPWGEIAEQLGVYETIKEHDQKRRAPGTQLLNNILFKNQPVLILMDEIAEYVVKTRDFADQVFAFCQEITETIKSLERCTLICTLPSSAPYGEEGERALSQLQRIFGRVETIYTPVEGEEIYEIIRKRLFEDLGDPQEHKLVADEYFDIYQKLGEDIPSEAKETRYRDKIKRTYPFHPDLIDTLFERWGTIPAFQRTRGVLRLLAEVVQDLYTRERPSPLIQPAHVNLANSSIRREFIKHIGNEYEGVIASDIDGESAKSPRIDREMGTEYLKYKVATGLATSIFFYSFSGSEKRGVSLSRLRLALLRKGIPPAIVGDAMRRLEDELWFLYPEKSLYCFKNQPNLNRVIIEKEEIIKDEDVDREIRETITNVAGREFDIFLFPKSSRDIPDDKRLKLAILSPQYAIQDPSTKEFLYDLLTKRASGFRIYKNTLLFLVPDSNEYEGLSKTVRRFLVLKDIKDDKNLVKTLSEENRQNLGEKLKNAESAIPLRILSTYRHLAKGSKDGVEFLDMGIPTIGEKSNLTKRVKEYLKDQEKLLDKISPKYLLERGFAKEDEKKTLKDIWETFLKVPDLPILDNEDVLKTVIIEGTRNKNLGILTSKKVYYGECIPANELSNEVWVVREDIAQKIKMEEGVKPEGEKLTAEEKKKEEIKPVKGIKKFGIRVRLPWDKLSSFVSGVLSPLHRDGAKISLEVKVSAESEEGISKDTLDLKIKETLDQIGAEILEQEEE